MRMDGQRIVIFGGTGDFGITTAKAALAIGAEVVIASPSPDKVKDAAESLGKGATGLVADVNDDQALARAFKELGAVDHVAMTVGGPIKARGLAPVEDAKTVFETRFWGQYRVARAAAEKLYTAKSLTFTSGASSVRPLYGALLGSMLNATVDSMTRVMATQLGPMRVNSVAPGVIDSNQLRLVLPQAEREAFFAKLADTLPTARPGRSEEIAKAFLFLMDNSYMTGTTVYVDGGALLAA